MGLSTVMRIESKSGLTPNAPFGGIVATTEGAWAVADAAPRRMKTIMKLLI